jgi:hypothetical protein
MNVWDYSDGDREAHEYATLVAETVGSIEEELEEYPDVPRVEELIDEVLGVEEWRYEAAVNGPVTAIIAVVSHKGPQCRVIIGDGFVDIEVRSGVGHALVSVFADHFATLVWALLEEQLPQEVWR